MSANTGGAIFLDNSTLLCLNCIFKNNAAISSGVIFAQSESNITMFSSQFISNMAYSEGVFTIQSDTIIYVTSSYFIENKAESENSIGLIFQTKYDVNFVLSDFLKNKAFISSDSAGIKGISIISTKGKTKFDRCTFSENLAKKETSNIMIMLGTNVIFTKCNFENKEFRN